MRKKPSRLLPIVIINSQDDIGMLSRYTVCTLPTTTVVCYSSDGEDSK